MSNKATGAGKGDKARNNYSREFRDNYDEINWGRGKSSVKDDGRLDRLDLEVNENNCKYATTGPKSEVGQSNRRGNILDRIRQKKIK